jgi:TonB family protein
MNMNIRQNIIISLILHIILITVSFSVNFRERQYPFPGEYVIISVVEEMTAMTSIESSPISPQQLERVYREGIASQEPTSNNTKFFINTQTRTEPGHSSASPQTCPERYGDILQGIYSEPSFEILRYAQNDAKRRDDIKRRNNKEEGASENSKAGTTILVNQHAGISEEMNILHANTKENESNPPSPPENPPTSPFNKGGQRGLEGGLMEQNTASQNTAESRSSEDKILKSPKRDAGLYAFIRSSIEKAKNYPLLARERGIEGTVVVSFRINGKGFPQGVKILKSSGYQILDEEVPKMLKKASPFPELNGEILIPISFKLIESTSER